MSIFYGTIHKTIAAQLKAREFILGPDNIVRDSDFLQFTSGKNSWVRMVSGVDVYDKNTKTYSSDLAKKWTLEGGVPYNSDTLRYGVGNNNSVYSSNLDARTAPPYGFRPMPGIISVSVMNKGAYGSLRQAVVRFQCWDKDQLDQLEKLYMRVGYTIFLEWGWSLYIDHKDSAVDRNSVPDNKEIKNFIERPVDPFVSQDEDSYFKNIDDSVLKHKGNYDAMIGYVQNFSWQLLPNGGFDCSTTIISRGEVLTELKNSSNPFNMVDSTVTSTNYIKSTYDPGISGNVSERAVLSLFEKIFLNIKAYKNQSEIYNPNGELYVKYDGNPSVSVRQDNSDAIASQVNQSFTSIKTEVSNGSYVKFDYGADAPEQTSPISINPFQDSLLKPADGSGEGVAIEYITFNELIAILNTFFIFKNEKTKKPVVDIVLPSGTPCLVCEDSVSIDPTTCLINNPYATFITEITGSAYKAKGFQPNFYSLAGGYNTPPYSSSFDVPTYYPKYNFVTKVGGNKNGDVLRGDMGNILISITKIIEVYRRLMTSDGVSIIDYLQTLLEDISKALGGINDFKVYTNKNKVIIFDAKYLEVSTDPSGGYSKKFNFNLIGLKSICRDVKINSRVFSEQSSMIAIGAMASGNQENLGDIYSSTQQAFNKGLKDRVIQNIFITDPTKVGTRVDVNGNPLDPELAYYYDVFKNLVSLRNYLHRKSLGDYIPGHSYGSGVEIIRIPSSEEIINTSSILKTYLLQFNGKDLDFKAIIPLELEITLDGISGFIIGQIFTIDTSILPTLYKSNNVGFIITGISHTLQNNDWTTTLKTQMCLLDNDKLENKMRINNKKKLKDIITQISKQTQKNSYIALAMADYLVYLTIGIMNVGRNIHGSNDYPSGVPGGNNNKKNQLGLTGTNGLAGKLEDYRGIVVTDSPLGWGNPFGSETEDKVGTETGANSAFVKTRAGIIKDDMPFYRKATQSGYLREWYNIVQPQAASLGLPEFPATFDELVNAKDLSGLTIPLEDNIMTFNSEVIGTQNYSTINTSTISIKDIFFYKNQYLGLKPFEKLKNSFKEEPGTTNRGGIYDKVELKINDLFQYYLLGGVRQYIGSWGINAMYVDPLVYSTYYSLESGTSGTKVKWIN